MKLREWNKIIRFINEEIKNLNHKYKNEFDSIYCPKVIQWESDYPCIGLIINDCFGDEFSKIYINFSNNDLSYEENVKKVERELKKLEERI